VKGAALIPWNGRKCYEGTRETGEPGPNKCNQLGTVVRYSRAWCDLHDPDRVALEIAFAMLIQVTRKAAA
jgi:hypothetical protein